MASRMKTKKSDDCPLSETLKAPHFYRRRNLFFSIWWCFLWVFNHVQTNLFKRKNSMNICHKLHRQKTQHDPENWGLRGEAKMTSTTGVCFMPLGAFWSSSWRGSWQQRQQSARCHVWFVCKVLRVSLGGSMMRHCRHCSFVLVGRPSMSPEHQSTRCTVKMQIFN